MSASYVSRSQPMSEGRINYHAPLKSVRTRRAIVVQDSPKLSFDSSDDGRTSPSGGDVKRPGFSFMWENAPGKPKIEEKEELFSPAELKPPPQSLPSIKARDAAVSSPPPAGTPPARVNPFATLPPKPFPPVSKTITTSMQQTTDRTPPRSHPVVPKRSSPARGSVTPTRQSRSGDKSSTTDDLRKPVVERERNYGGTAVAESRNSHNSLDRGSHHYLSERVRPAPPAQKDFYFPPRNAPSTTVPKSPYSTQPSSRLPTLPGSHDSSEAGGSHTSAEWDGEHNSDAGDIYSQMDHYQAQCQVSMLDGCIEPDFPDTSRHTDPRARDFIMQRFLPAAKAMVTESPDSSDRRSPNGTPDASPRKGTRSAAAGRSRFATYKQRSEAEDEETEEEDPGMLFKCKFPWQVSPFGSLCLPAPAPQAGVTKGRAEGTPVEEMEPAWTYAASYIQDTEGSKDEHSRSFESTGFRARNGSYTNTDGGMFQQQRDHDTLEHSPSFSVDSQTGDYNEGEGSMRSTDSRRAYSSNLSNREPAAPQTPPRRKTEHEFAGNLGTLLRTSNPGKGMGKLVQPGQQPEVAEAEARRQSQVDSSIPNHHRYQSRQQTVASGSLADLGARDIDPGQFQSRSHASSSSSTPSLLSLSNNEDGNNYPRHLRQSLYRHEAAGGSGRSLESIDDEAWETIDRETSSSTGKNNREDQQRSDRHGPAVPPLTTTANSNLFDNTDDSRAIGWPLGKAYSAFSRVSSTDSKQESSYSRTPSTDSKHGSSYVRTASSESKAESAYTRTGSNDSKYDSSYIRTASSDSKHESPYARTPSTDSKNESFSSFSDHSPANYSQHKASEKFSPVSVLQPPLPKAPRESWLGKLMPAVPAPLTNMSNWQQAGPKKYLEHSMADDSMDVKWEALVKSENAHVRNVRLAQDVQSRDRD